MKDVFTRSFAANFTQGQTVKLEGEDVSFPCFYETQANKTEYKSKQVEISITERDKFGQNMRRDDRSDVILQCQFL